MLDVYISGLYLVEELEAAMMVHLVDSHAVGVSPHLAQLQALKSIIDDTQTTKPDAAHVLMANTPNETWVWDLKGRWVTMPPSDSGDDDLTPLGTSTEDANEVPSGDAGWNSRARIADLRACGGATRITNENAVASTMMLTHGQVDVLDPGGPGSRAVWQFTGKDDEVLMKRALSDKVRYSCPTAAQQLTVWIDDVPVVFKAAGGAVSVMNMPTAAPPSCPGCKPTMKHFSAFYKMVDKQVTPEICLFRYTPKTNEDAGTDYCPGGRI
jgi:hypothetical protein